jgi:hypothetical protein
MRRPLNITLAPIDQSTLEGWLRSRTLPVRQVERARIILGAAAGRGDKDLAAELGCSRQRCDRTWRRFQAGGVQALSGQALRQAAGDLARRLKAHCHQHGILWIECGPGDLKYEIAREHRPKDPAFRGVFAVLVGRAPAPLWQVRRNGQGQITELRRTEPWPYVQHYYFQSIDPE